MGGTEEVLLELQDNSIISPITRTGSNEEIRPPIGATCFTSRST